MESLAKTIDITSTGDYKPTERERLTSLYNSYVDRAMKADNEGKHEEAGELYNLAINIVVWMQELN